MNTNLLNKAKAILSDRRIKERIEAENRKKEIYNQIPRIKEIDDEISALGISLVKSAVNGENYQSALAELQKSSQRLLEEKCELLVSSGYPYNYLDIHKNCPKCGDEGYVGYKMCSCLKELYKEAAYKAAHLPVLMDKQSFKTFNIDYYPDSDEDPSPRKIMETVLAYCKRYARTFSAKSTNILMYGGTGLGKTFLSSCIAKELIENDKSVYYQPAYRIFSMFEERKFSNSDNEIFNIQIKYIYDSDLLIIDDLGTELVTAYTAQILFDLINTRINSGKKIIISTNLSLEDIETIYSPRISSRLVGNFDFLEFVGDDIRNM